MKKRKAYGINRVEVAEPLPPLGGWEGNINKKNTCFKHIELTCLIK